MIRVLFVIVIGIACNVGAWLFAYARRSVSLMLALVILSFMSFLAMYEAVRRGGGCSSSANRPSPPVPDHVAFTVSEGMSGDGCIICLEPHRAGDRCRLLSCGHIFHEQCMRAWAGPCPLKCGEASRTGAPPPPTAPDGVRAVPD